MCEYRTNYYFFIILLFFYLILILILILNVFFWEYGLDRGERANWLAKEVLGWGGGNPVLGLSRCY